MMEKTAESKACQYVLDNTNLFNPKMVRKGNLI